MLAAILGILKAGAAYVPLDPSFPSERLQFIATDAQIALLICSSASQAGFDPSRVRSLLLDADAKAIAAQKDSPLPANELAAQPEDPAYVIYTSGSTGQPKGVVVPHRAVVNFLTSMAREPGLQERDVLLAVTTVSFDIAVLELLLPLTVGASVVIATHAEAMDGRSLASLLGTYRATLMQATPITWRLLLEAGWNAPAPFKALVGGEPLPQDLAGALLGQGVQLWNMYGPTETTVWSTCARIADTAKRITIGKPIANTVIRILDPYRGLCPIGVPGELCIGGAGLSLGYWDRPELTTARFIADPCGSHPGALLYCTGDRARWCPDGTIEHLGRLDFQVKLRGFRIEPGEIEANIARHPAVREAAVVAREQLAEHKQLVAYVVAPNAPTALAEQLRKLLRSALPEYMVPSQFVLLPALPRTLNGKLDRPALPAPPAARLSPQVTEAPRTATEQMVFEIFRDVLGRTNFGVLESFFDLDGNSLMAARIMFQLSARTGRDLPLRLLFERQTVCGLAEALDALGFLESNEQRCELGDHVEIEL
jgi:amino acid adenylation domain-containing protein